jgi:hypothetical protein
MPIHCFHLNPSFWSPEFIQGSLSTQVQQNMPGLDDTQPEKEEEDLPPPPPSPPKLKKHKLPPNWKSAKDGDGKSYYYHTVTK